MCSDLRSFIIFFRCIFQTHVWKGVIGVGMVIGILCIFIIIEVGIGVHIMVIIIEETFADLAIIIVGWRVFDFEFMRVQMLIYHEFNLLNNLNQNFNLLVFLHLDYIE